MDKVAEVINKLQDRLPSNFYCTGPETDAIFDVDCGDEVKWKVIFMPLPAEFVIKQISKNNGDMNFDWEIRIRKDKVSDYQLDAAASLILNGAFEVWCCASEDKAA